MALARRLRRLLSKAAQASVSRSRFSDAEAITIAFATGVVLVRAAAYTVLSLSQFSGADPTAFVAAVAGTILAVWCCTGTVALANAGARSRPALLLFGIPSAAFIQRRWILMVAMRRGLTGVAALFALPVLGVVIVRAPAPGLAEPVILVLLAVGLSVSGLLLAARHGRSLGSAASLVAPSLVCIAVAGPDLRISGGVVVPLFLGASALNEGGVLRFPVALIPLVFGLMPLAVSLTGAFLMRAVRRRRASLAGLHTLRRHLESLLFGAGPVGRICVKRISWQYWFLVVAVSIGAALFSARMAVPSVIVSTGGLVYAILRIGPPLSGLSDGAATLKPPLRRPFLRALAGVVCLHGAVATAAMLLLS